MSTSGPDIGDIAALVFHYVPSFLICVLAIGALLLIAHFRKPRASAFRAFSRPLAICVPLLIWLLYLMFTGHNAYAISCLDSENNLFAADVYETDFTVDLSQALALAHDEGHSGNVLFYASCRIADLLAGANESTVTEILQQADDIPAFQTGFGGTNRITCGYFIPNHTEGPFTVRGIIEKRMRAMGHTVGQ